MDKILDWIVSNPVPVIIIILVLFVIFTYNNLNAKRNRAKKSFSTIDVYLNKRFDEIGALLEQLEMAYDHEGETYKQIAAARSGIATAQLGAINDKVNAVNNFSRMLAIPGLKSEDYPKLEALSLQGMFVMNKTSAVEDDLAAARKQYNNNANSYNTKITSFPSNLVAKIFGFGPLELFKAAEEAKERPTTMRTKKSDFKAKLDMETMELAAKLEREKMLKQAELDMKTMEANTPTTNESENKEETE